MSIWQRAVFCIIKELQINNKTDILMEEWTKAWPYLRYGQETYEKDLTLLVIRKMQLKP